MQVGEDLGDFDAMLQVVIAGRALLSACAFSLKRKARAIRSTSSRSTYGCTDSRKRGGSTSSASLWVRVGAVLAMISNRKSESRFHERYVPAVANDDMIDDRNADQPPGFGELPRDLPVVGRG